MACVRQRELAALHAPRTLVYRSAISRVRHRLFRLAVEYTDFQIAILILTVFFTIYER